MAIGVIILNYNNVEDTLNCITSLYTYNTANVKIIVVDNGSKDHIKIKLIERLKESFNDCKVYGDDSVELDNLPYITVICHNKNLGYAKGNNLGLKFVETIDEIDKILILNNDILFYHDIIPSLVKKMDLLNDCAIISPILYVRDRKSIDYTCARLAPSASDLIKECFMISLNINSYRKVLCNKYWLFIKNPLLKEKEQIEIEMPSGSCMLINKSLFKEIGYFDPNTFLYYEENILYAKIKTLGLKSYLIPSLGCIHLGAGSTKKATSNFIQKCALNSRSYYLKTYGNMNFIQKICFKLASTLLKYKINCVEIKEKLKK